MCEVQNLLKRRDALIDELAVGGWKLDGDGMLGIPERPGLGVEIDETLAGKYPYKRAYLPVNRLEDGTMANW